MLPLQRKNTGDAAHGTTSQEFLDNLYWIVHNFQQKTNGQKPILCYDNIKIQKIADIKELKFPGRPTIQIDVEKQKLHMPTYSPDMNRPIEHIFGYIKPKVRGHLYEDYDKYTHPDQLQQLVFKVFNYELVEGAVKKDVDGLPLLWHVISTPFGEEYTDSDHDIHMGTGGDYPNAQYR